jgi:hypothetical protein
MLQRIVPVTLALALFLVVATANFAAAQSPPMRLYGVVTAVGAPVAAGTAVQALAGSAICGSGAVGSGGSYQVDVFTGPSSPCHEGALLGFTVGGRPAIETVNAQPGAFVSLNLTVTATLPASAAPTAATETVALVAGCNNVVTTWPGATPSSTIAASVTPAGGLLAIWRYDAAAARFLGFAPQAVGASDLTAVNRLDPVFICMNTSGTMTRPRGAL